MKIVTKYKIMEEADKVLECEKLRESLKESKSKLWSYIKFILWPALTLVLTEATNEKDFDLKDLGVLLICLFMWLGIEIREILLEN